MKEKEFDKFPKYLGIVLAKLGYESEMSFVHLPADLEELITEIEHIINGIDPSLTLTDEKKKICDDVESLWQKVKTFKVPSGHKNYIEGLRCRCKSKVDAATQTEVISTSTYSMKPEAPRITKEKILDLVKKYLGSLPQPINEREVKVKRLNGDDNSWSISCPLCSSTIAVQMKGKNIIATNYKRHIETHKDFTAIPPAFQTNLLNSENDSNSSSSVPTQQCNISLDPSISQQSDVQQSTSRLSSKTPSLSSTLPVRDNRKRNIDSDKILPSTELSKPNTIKGLERFQVKREKITRQAKDKRK